MSRGLSKTVLRVLEESKIIGVRAGARSTHRFIGVWPVTLDGRLFARSWTLKPDGWYHALLADPRGVIQVGDREIRVRAVAVRSERLRDAIDKAYAAKFTTPGALKYVRGFRTPKRRNATVEFVPR
jgi:hypothetical protein